MANKLHMCKVLVTGATGNVGSAVLLALKKTDHPLQLFAGVRNIEVDRGKLKDYGVAFVRFDFEDISTYTPALEGIQMLFLLRPPQIADVKKFFKPLIDACKEVGVLHIVFLSVQGAEDSTFIPHHKIEKLIVESKIEYTFLRPAYFMQNFTTTLRNDLLHKNLIFLPAGKAKFTLIDVRDIGKVAAHVLTSHPQHINMAYALTGIDLLTFGEMTTIMNRELNKSIRFESPNLLRFFLVKRKEKMPVMFILVMIMLHYFPRFQKPPALTDWDLKITGEAPYTFRQFLRDYKSELGGMPEV